MKFSVITLGCKVNYCESAEIAYSMTKAGFEKVDPEDSPDVVIINSCAVTGTGVKKAERIISKFKSLNTGTVIVLCGCFPQAYSEQAYGTSADIVLGNALKYSAAEFVKRFLENGEPIRAAGELTNDFLMLSDQAPSDFDRTRAFIKIEDGCDNFCSYCIIPFARGRVRSAPVEFIKKAAENAVNDVSTHWARPSTR